MKTPDLIFLNSLGFTRSNPAQLVAYFAWLLQAGYRPNRGGLIQPEIKAVPEVLAQPAHPAYPARPAMTAAQNPTGYSFGALYLNSPAYPPNTPIPAIPAKAATAAVAGKPAILGQPKIDAPIVKNPYYDPNISPIVFNSSPGKLTINIGLPILKSPIIGSNGAADLYQNKILEFTDPVLKVAQWFGSKPSSNLGDLTLADIDLTVEQSLLKAIKLYSASSPISINIGNNTYTGMVQGYVDVNVNDQNNTLSENYLESGIPLALIGNMIQLPGER